MVVTLEQEFTYRYHVGIREAFFGLSDTFHLSGFQEVDLNGLNQVFVFLLGELLCHNLLDFRERLDQESEQTLVFVETHLQSIQIHEADEYKLMLLLHLLLSLVKLLLPVFPILR